MLGMKGLNTMSDRKIILPPKKKKVELKDSSVIPATELLLHDA